MLPSMPIIFTRDSQDAFGNKILPSTSFFSQNSLPKADINPEPPPPTVEHNSSKETQKETEIKDQNKKEIVKDSNAKADDISALDAALVRSYYTKVQSRFASNQSVPTNMFVQFQSILKSFDPSKETPVDLYKKIEQLFGVENKDIVEEFLLFLKPGQAAQVGRFTDHFMMTKLTAFIDLLQSSFARKPTVLRKILRAISSGMNSGASAEMRARVLPHLRSNQKLTLMFKCLFPDERPPDSLYNSGTDILSESFLTADKGYDVWNFPEEKNSKRKPEENASLDTVYMQGRVFLQHGRLLRPASVTYPYSKEPYRVHTRRFGPHSPPISDEETTSPKRNKTAPKTQKRTKKQLKSPTKNNKDVNDNTKHKDAVLNVLNSPKSVKGKAQNCKTKCKKDEVKTDKKEKREKSEKVVKKDEASKPKLAKIEADSRKSEVKSNNWTRDEDKTMLQVLKGEAGSEQVFCRIQELLPHRSCTEIKERFCHVMTLLQEMAVDVT